MLKNMHHLRGFCDRFCKQSDETKRQKVNLILDKLITMTIDEVQMYPSIQAKIWGNIGVVSDLLDMVLDSFIKVKKIFIYFFDYILR